MNDVIREPNGRFGPGTAPGPGRPRRCIEGDYLATIADAVPMGRWRAIVDRAVQQAVAGNCRAPEWLAGYLVGRPTGDGLVTLAGNELAGIDPATAAAEAAAHEARIAELFRLEQLGPAARRALGDSNRARADLRSVHLLSGEITGGGPPAAGLGRRSGCSGWA
jgi:hypothetical protein